VVGSSLLASLTAKIALATAAATAAASGLAAAGALPAPVQQVAANVASTVGLDIPGGAPSQPSVTTTTHDGDQPEVTETESPEVTETESPEVTGTVTGTVTPNHGGCVSFATHQAEDLGLSGSQKGAFVSMVASDPTAVSVKVGDDGKPDAACLAAIAKAEAAVKAASPKKCGDDQGEDNNDHGDHEGNTPTATVTPTSTVTPGTCAVTTTVHDDSEGGSHSATGSDSHSSSKTGSPSHHGD